MWRFDDPDVRWAGNLAGRAPVMCDRGPIEMGVGAWCSAQRLLAQGRRLTSPCCGNLPLGDQRLRRQTLQVGSRQGPPGRQAHEFTHVHALG